MLVSGKELLLLQKRRLCGGAFNLNNMEILQAIIEAAEEENSCISQASQGGIKHASVEYIAGMAKVAAEKAKCPWH